MHAYFALHPYFCLDLGGFAWKYVSARRLNHCLEVFVLEFSPLLNPFLPQQPDFDYLRKAHVGEQRQRQNWPVHRRQFREAQR